MSLWSDVLARQTAHGAFLSEVSLRGDHLVDDENAFMTALVLFELFRQEPTPAVSKAIDHALDFIEACEEQAYSGVFCFYPSRLPSARLAIPLQADLDDSALSMLALMHAGRRSREWGRAVVPAVFDGNRLLYTSAHPAWVRPGAFKTWIGGEGDNPVDCGVNIHVLALYAYLGLGATAAYQTALQSVLLGLKLTGLDPLHMRHLAPFYAHPGQVYECLRRAVDFGAVELTPQLAVHRHLAAHRTSGVSHPVCCNYWGQPLWYSRALQLAYAAEPLS